VTFVNRSPLFAIRRVHVAGLAALLPEEAALARAAATLPAGTNFFHLDRAKLESALERVPAVAGARISRRFPNRVEIAITPRAPVAILACGESRWEVDRAGVAIRPERAGQRLPVIDCASPENVEAGRRIDVPGVAGALAAAVFCASTSHGKPLGIAKIEVDQNGDMCLNMVDSVAIRIGQNDQLDAKLALVRRIYDERPDIGAEVESIDLRFPEAPACLPRGTAKQGRESSQPATTDAAGARERDSTRGPKGTATDSHLEPISSGNTESAIDSPAGRSRGHSHRSDSPDTGAERRRDPSAESPESRR
jgi:cell division septal protein FtsQ